jgi:hypothetical protein
MFWYHHVAHFFGAVFFANAIPHLVYGITGRPLQTPFASPPFRGLSPAPVNVSWALVNLALAYVLLAQVGTIELQTWVHVGAPFAGFALASVGIARSFARIRSGAGSDPG